MANKFRTSLHFISLEKRLEIQQKLPELYTGKSFWHFSTKLFFHGMGDSREIYYRYSWTDLHGPKDPVEKVFSNSSNAIRSEFCSVSLGEESTFFPVSLDAGAWRLHYIFSGWKPSWLFCSLASRCRLVVYRFLPVTCATKGGKEERHPIQFLASRFAEGGQWWMPKFLLFARNFLVGRALHTVVRWFAMPFILEMSTRGEGGDGRMW